MPIETSFAVKIPDVNGLEEIQRMSGLVHGNTESGPSTSSVEGTGSASGDVADICGLKISTSETVVAFENVWDIRHSRLFKSQDQREKVLHYAERCISKYFFGVIPIQVDGGLTFYNPQNKQIHSEGDFLQAAYPLEQAGPDGKAPTVMLFMSGWGREDRNTIVNPNTEAEELTASEVFVESLRKHHIKLYLLSTENLPNHILVDYAKESGGQVSVTPQPPLKDLP